MKKDAKKTTYEAPPAILPKKKLVYAVTEKGERTFWTKIGEAFVNRDGSLSVTLTAAPINGRLQIRDVRC